MASPDDTADWLLDDILGDLGGDGACGGGGGGFSWAPQGLSSSPSPSPSYSNLSVEIGSYLNTSDVIKEPGSRKRLRSGSCSRPLSKACREKMRRDKLNDRFRELGSVLDPEKPPKADKAAMLSDATRTVIQLRTEAQQLKDTSESLEEKIKELKAEKDELRDEKQKLIVEKESLEQQIKLMRATPAYLPQPQLIPTPFAAQGRATGHKLVMPVIGYPGYPMWQFMPPSEVDTSTDTETCPPVA